MPHDDTAPLVPAEVDLTDFKFMPLEVSRLLRSEFWLNAMDNDARIAAASVNLWAESWHQRPAASLPKNDAVLARLAMVDRSVWMEIREAVMEPWVLCSDGRWYHPVVAEKAVSAWAEKQKHQARKQEFSDSQRARAAARWGKDGGSEARQTRSERLAEARRKATHTKEQWATLLGYCGGKCCRCGSLEGIVKDHIVPIYQGGSDGIENIQPLCTRCNSSKGPEGRDFRPTGWEVALGVPARTPARTPAETPANKREKEREKERDFIQSANALSSDAAAPEPPEKASGEGYTAEFEAWWALYPRKDGKGAAFRAFRTAKRLVTVERLTEGVRAYARRMHGSEPRFIKQPATWLNQHCWNDEPTAEPPKVRPKIAGYVPMGNGG